MKIPTTKRVRRYAKFTDFIPMQKKYRGMLSALKAIQSECMSSFGKSAETEHEALNNIFRTVNFTISDVEKKS